METPTVPRKKIEDLPSDLIENIISRLPVHSVFHCRQVCRSWNSLINNPDHRLPILHYTRSVENPNHPSSLIFLFHTFPVDSFEHHLRYLQDIDQPDKGISGKDLPFKHLLKGLNVVGSCNGLLCLSNDLHRFFDKKWEVEKKDRAVIIFNPVNGDYTIPPKAFNSPISHPKYHMVSFGFGYNQKRKEYKVVRIEEGEIPGSRTTRVFTLGSNSWRSIETTTTRRIPWFRAFNVHVNGFLYCFTLVDGYSTRVDGLEVFDLEHEIFGVVSLPDALRGKRYHELFLGTFGGCLMIVDPWQRDMQLVWLMKNCGEEKSWTIEFIVPVPPKQPDCIDEGITIRPLSMQKSGKVLLQYDASLFSYDPGTRTHELIPNTLPDAFTTTPHIGTFAKLEHVISLKE